MPAKQSAGIIAYHYNENGELLVLLVHPGGPFWQHKNEGAWSIPKGEYLEGEDAYTVACREFSEETGNQLTADKHLQLRPVKIKSGKMITAFAIEAFFPQPFISSNTFEMEWPPRSGNLTSFPEIDRAEWLDKTAACRLIQPGQLPLLHELFGTIPTNPSNK